MKIVETNSFRKKFDKLIEKVTPEEKAQIIKAISEFCLLPLCPPDYLDDGKLKNKKLEKKLGHTRSFRPHHDYRIVYVRNTGDDEIIFLTIGHRKEVYRDLNKNL